MFLLQVFSALIKIVVFVTTFMLFILFCCFFLEKMVIQKTQKRILFSFPSKNKFQRFAFTYLTKNHS